MVILVERLDRIAEAIGIGQRTRRIARQSIVVGMGLSGVAMAAAALGFLSSFIADALDDATGAAAQDLVREADAIVSSTIVTHGAGVACAWKSISG